MELFRTLATLAEPPVPDHAPLAELLGLGAPPAPTEFTELFELQLYPYASFYLGADGLLGGEARDRIAGFWRALGETPPAEPDHLSLMLALQARLAELEEAAPDGRQRRSWRAARRAWLWEHLLSWLPIYCDRMATLGGGYYRRWAGLLAASLAEEATLVGVQDRLPLHLREAPGMVDPRTEGGEAFLGALLAPARSGLVLVRADLETAARELGLGCRAGERRFALQSLLGQDAGRVLDWLARAAGGAADRYRELAPGGPWAGFWVGRARATGTLLTELSATASAVG